MAARLSRFDRRTGQVLHVGPPRGADYRALRTAPVMFSPLDPHVLFFASNTLWKTSNGGVNWTQISPTCPARRGKPGERRRLSTGGHRPVHPPRRDLCDRAVERRFQRDLGRHG
jgi:hypothetical protein